MTAAGGQHVRDGSVRPETAQIEPVEPVEGAERTLHGDCLFYDPRGHGRCELVAGHELPHQRGPWGWA